MSWSDFDEESALERDMLQRALPLLSIVADPSNAMTIDMGAQGRTFHDGSTRQTRPDPSDCVEALRIRPLLVGAAWKVVDLLLETAFEEDGLAPDSGDGWKIDTKLTHARKGHGRPEALREPVWAALTRTYVETAELRHSLVHRRAYTNEDGALVGTTRKDRSPLRPLTASEQEAFARAALRAAEVVTAEGLDSRVEADLIGQLRDLSGVHCQALPPETLDPLERITVILDPDSDGSGRYVFDVPQFLERAALDGKTRADLVIEFYDRPGQDLCCRLEDLPNDIERLDPDNPPNWLS